MKSEGYFLKQKGISKRAFELRSFETRKLEINEVLIETEAFGLNYADVMARNGLYREAPPMPCILGYEVVGKIIEVGSSENHELIGKRVVAFCRFGGYARHVVTQVNACAMIDSMDANQALALATQGVTAFYMSRYIAPIKPNENVLIHAAAGGVGTLLIQLAKAEGARVFAKVGSDEKRELCMELGADFTINYKSGDYSVELARMLGDGYLDVSFNPVGGATFKSDMKLSGAGSKIILFGGSDLANGKWGFLSQLNFVRKMGFFTPIVLMMKSKSIIGVNMLKIADSKPDVLQLCMQSMVDLYKSGKITVTTGGKFNFNQLFEAHDLLESGKSMGKISVHWN